MRVFYVGTDGDNSTIILSSTTLEVLIYALRIVRCSKRRTTIA